MENLEIDTINLTETLMEVCQKIRDATQGTTIENSNLTPPDIIYKGLEQFCEIMLHLDHTVENDEKPEFDDNDAKLDELADFGLGLIEQLMDWAEWADMMDERETLDDLIITVGVWCARYLGKMKQIEPVVNALSKVANNNSEPEFLAELSQIYNEIANAVAPEVKKDLEGSKPQQPWRILNLNYAIVATRSHDPALMEQAFEQILVRLDDEDARGFFREGLEQMDSVGYPDHVRHMMEKYYQLTNKPTLH